MFKLNPHLPTEKVENLNGFQFQPYEFIKKHSQRSWPTAHGIIRLEDGSYVKDFANYLIKDCREELLTLEDMVILLAFGSVVHDQEFLDRIKEFDVFTNSSDNILKNHKNREFSAFEGQAFWLKVIYDSASSSEILKVINEAVISLGQEEVIDRLTHLFLRYPELMPHRNLVWDIPEFSDELPDLKRCIIYRYLD